MIKRAFDCTLAGTGLLTTVGVIVFVLFVFPVYWMVSTAARSP